MAAPEYVPRKPTAAPRSYLSPPRNPDSWHADRPGDLHEHQPRGEGLGNQGPDQGYVLVLARRFDDKLHLAPGEEHDDAVAGAIAVALKRASLFGRAPVIHDLTVAFTLWAFLDPDPPEELVAVRRGLFEGAANPYHYGIQRTVADAVPAATLQQPHEAVVQAHEDDWRSLLELA